MKVTKSLGLFLMGLKTMSEDMLKGGKLFLLTGSRFKQTEEKKKGVKRKGK